MEKKSSSTAEIRTSRSISLKVTHTLPLVLLLPFLLILVPCFLHRHRHVPAFLLGSFLLLSSLSSFFSGEISFRPIENQISFTLLAARPIQENDDDDDTSFSRNGPILFRRHPIRFMPGKPKDFLFHSSRAKSGKGKGHFTRVAFDPMFHEATVGV